MTTILGIDIGGSGIKGAPVDVVTGTLVAERQRIATPIPATPQACADVVAELAAGFTWTGPVGVTYPGVVRAGIVFTAANVDPAWIGTDGAALVAESTGCPTCLLNDADAAGLAEVRFGAGRGRPGVVVVLTLGTGIGSAVFVDGVLVPNTELGHLEVDGADAESRAAARVREAEGLSWGDYAARLDRYLHVVEDLFWPELLIIGGGISKKPHKFIPLLTVRTEVVPAQLANNAGIVGAALAAHQLTSQ